MIGTVLARRYARAVLEMAREKKLVDEVGTQLDTVASTFQGNPALGNRMADPTVPHARKKELVALVLRELKVSGLAAEFLGVLLAKNRILGIGDIAEAYRALSDEYHNRVRAKVVSAAPLEKDELDRLTKLLARLSGKDVVVEAQVDEGLLGGVVAYVGGKVYDGSLRSQLHQIRESLTKGR